MTPVVFIHYGKAPDYLTIAIKQAKKYNEVVYLITDQEDADVEANVVLMSSIDEEAKSFQNVYHHLSKNPIDFELRCFTRWGLMLSLMDKERLSRVFYCDSDVLLYANVDVALSDADVAYSIPQHQPDFRWTSSAHVSIFSYDKLAQFWKFIVSTYTNRTETFGELKRKYKHHLANGAPGGVCDMTLLYLFAQKTDVAHMCGVIDGTTFDHNINSSENTIKDEYEMRDAASPYGTIRIKNIRMIDGKPVCLNLDMDTDIVFNCLHFQGGSKALMPHFV